MASPVLELQEAATDANQSVATLLRKARLIAAKLNQPDFETWAVSELEGYKDYNGVPDYRRVRSILQAFNHYSGTMVPLMFHDDTSEDTFKRVHITQSVGTLDDLLAHHMAGGVLSMSLTDTQQQALMKMFGMEFVTDRRVSKVQLVGLLDAVRNRILSWAIELERADILGEGLKFTPKEKASASHITIGSVIGNVSAISGSHDVTVSQHSHYSANDTTAILNAVKGIRCAAGDVTLPPETTADLAANLGTVELQARAATPDQGIMRRALASIVRVGEGAAGGALGQAAAEHFGVLAKFAGL